MWFDLFAGINGEWWKIEYITYSISTCIFVFCDLFCRFCIACIKFPSILPKAITLHKNKTYTYKPTDCINFDTGTEYQRIYRTANGQLRIRICKWIFSFVFINSKRFPDFSELKKNEPVPVLQTMGTYELHMHISPACSSETVYWYMKYGNVNEQHFEMVCNIFGISFILITNSVILFFPLYRNISLKLCI